MVMSSGRANSSAPPKARASAIRKRLSAVATHLLLHAMTQRRSAVPSAQKALTESARDVINLLRCNNGKGGDPMSHSKVARRAVPANQTLVTSVRIG
jgi:hypothetical protein